MKTIIQLVLTLVLLNAIARGGMVALDYFRLKDATQQMLTFGTQIPTRALHDQILAKAEELEIPVLSEDIEVFRAGKESTARLRYTQPVELFPRVSYPLKLNMTVGVMSLFLPQSDTLEQAPR